MMKGRIKNIYVNVDILKIDESLKGNYLEDKQFKHDFTMYVRSLWERKDALLERMLNDYESEKNKK